MMLSDADYLREIASPAHAFAGADAARIRAIADRLDAIGLEEYDDDNSIDDRLVNAGKIIAELQGKLSVIRAAAADLVLQIEFQGIYHHVQCTCRYCRARDAVRAALASQPAGKGEA